jgi:uncharacterized protein (UPF0261 family)
MKRSIVVIGTLDTKGEEVQYIKNLIEEKGHDAIVMDVGIVGEPLFDPAISHDDVAEASGSTLLDIIALNSEAKAMNKMAQGATKILRTLHASGKADGVLALGGTMGTSLALTVMKVLPVGAPKLMLSSAAYSPLIPPEAYSGNVMTVPWAAGLKGINRLSRQVLREAVGAIVGAVEIGLPPTRTKIVAVTAHGVSPCQYLNWLIPGLKERGYEVAACHAIGRGGRIMEEFITAGEIVGVLDLALNELANEVCGGAASAGKQRLEAAGKKGIPQIVNPIVNSFMWPTWKPVPQRYETRFAREHNWLVTNVNMSREEKVVYAELVANKLNQATGPVAVVIPMKGRGWAAVGGGGRQGNLPPDDVAGREAIVETLERHLRQDIHLVKLDTYLNDLAFSEVVLQIFDEMMQQGIAAVGA